MTISLTRQVDHDTVWRALDGWRWLPGLGGLHPWFFSVFGDGFLGDDAGAVWYLDLIEGSLTRQWGSAEECRAGLATPDGLDRYLLAGLAEGANAAGLAPADDEVLAFTLPPVVGGPLTVENLTTLSFVVAVDLAGQLHEQVKDLPPGTPISGFTIQ